MKQKPTEVLDNAIFRGCFLDKYNCHWRGEGSKPGRVVLDLNPEMREALKELKSDDISNIRPDAII